MNIRKYYQALPNETKRKIEKIVSINIYQGWAAMNGYNSICYELFESDPDNIWWINKRMERIAELIYWYVFNVISRSLPSSIGGR
jgi:hypothetical protein